MGEAQAFAVILQAAQGLTAGGILALIAYAYYSGRVVSKAAADKSVEELRTAKDEVITDLKAQLARSDARGDRWENIAWESVQAVQESTGLAARALEAAKAQQKGS